MRAVLARACARYLCAMESQRRSTAWTPTDDPFPPPHQFARWSPHQCHWFHERQLNASMCLMANDRVSTGIRETSGWIDHCTPIVRLWRGASGHHARTVLPGSA